MACDRNNISNNVIDLTANGATDIGIYLATGADDNYGDGNITYNCGTSVDDNGTSNSVVAQDV